VRSGSYGFTLAAHRVVGTLAAVWHMETLASEGED
jgi:hypothetical protein